MKTTLALSTIVLAIATTTSPAQAIPPVQVQPPYTGSDGSAVWARWDAQGRVVEAWGTDKNGVAHHLSADYANLKVTFDQTGKPSFLSEVIFNGEEMKIHESSGTRDLYFKVDCTNLDAGGNTVATAFDLYDNGQNIRTSGGFYGGVRPSLLSFEINTQHVNAFGSADSRTSYFGPMTKAIGQARAADVLQRAGNDPAKQMAIVLENWKDLKESLTTGVLVGAVCAIGATPLGWASIGIAFLTGLDGIMVADAYKMYLHGADRSGAAGPGGADGQGAPEGGEGIGGGQYTCVRYFDVVEGVPYVVCGRN